MRTIGSGLREIDTRRATPPPKRADAELLTAEHAAFRTAVLARAGYRCEWVEADGRRCPETRALRADHIVERADGGALYDLANGQCLCNAHNVYKGIQARAARR